MRRCPIIPLLLLLLPGSLARAHKPSDSYLALQLDGARIEGRWDISLGDLDYALGLDADGDGAITGREVRAAQPAIADYALSRLRIVDGRENCPTVAREHLITTRSDGAYAVLRFTSTCSQAPRGIEVIYGLLFDVDAQHRGLVRVASGQQVQTAVLRADAAERRFAVAAHPAGQQVLDFIGEGVRHIWGGIDHILFLLALLLPSVLRRERNAWRPVSTLKPAMSDVLKVVTAFTVAHSVTLSLSTLGAAALPPRLVETAIAASIVAAAVNNLYPLFEGRWGIAFALGLLHGFGFSNALLEMDLPRTITAVTLLGFNLGVEIGQLAIVAVFVPIAYAMRATWLYRRFALVGGSVAVGAIACVWSIDRLLS